jgi:hypothetical protein
MKSHESVHVYAALPCNVAPRYSDAVMNDADTSASADDLTIAFHLEPRPCPFPVGKQIARANAHVRRKTRW